MNNPESFLFSISQQYYGNQEAQSSFIDSTYEYILTTPLLGL